MPAMSEDEQKRSVWWRQASSAKIPGSEKKENAGDQEIINDDELALRKAEEAASRRYQAAAWLRQMDQLASETLSEKPSEEEFFLALRNGLILCNVLNCVSAGAIQKIVENPVITVQLNEGAAQSAIQYFENMRNFLVAIEDLQLLAFEASDLEKGGSSAKVVDCILCLKGYHEWKLAGGIGVWRYGGVVKITSLSKGFPSSCLDGPGSQQSFDYNTWSHNQRISETFRLVTGDFVEEFKAANALSFLFDQLVMRLLKTCLTECSDTEDLPLSEMFIDVILERAIEELYMLLVSHKNQLGLLMEKAVKDEMNSSSKENFLQAVSYFLKENDYGSTPFKFCFHGCRLDASKEDKLDNQQKQLEKLKTSFNGMKEKVECSRKKWEEDLQRLECHIQGLELNASSYSKLLEENRMLYNQVQDLKGSIRVYCRVRPFLTEKLDPRSTVEHIGENGDIMIVNPNKNGKDARKLFRFNKVFGTNTKQFEVFADTQPLVRSVMDGYNVCIFAYGQTGSGKTYTMSGPDLIAEETWGVNYRALDDLFHISESRRSIIKYDIGVQMIEIYNEQVRDLLVTDGSNRRLDIRNNSQVNGLNIPDASLVTVRCTEDVLELMKLGQGNRAIGATALNERSSRSHSILTVHVQGNELASSSKLKGCLHMVDLAGSERVDKSEAIGERLKEAQHINRSLSALGDVISALAQKTPHIPYRNSKLTQVLQDALGGQAKTLMFVHINPEVNAFMETISTLKFAERVASIELGAARANKECGQVLELKEEISRLRTALESKENELKLFKSSARQVALEMPKLRTKSPSRMSVMKKKHENYQSAKDGTAKSESRSCSSGKQSKPSCSSAFSDKDLDDKSPLFTNSSKLGSQSPVGRSSSTDRASIVRRRAKLETFDERGPVKLQFTERASPNIFRANESPTQSSRRLSSCGDLKENGYIGRVNKHSGKAENQIINHEKPIDLKKSERHSRWKIDVQRKNESSETENECSPLETLSNRYPMLKKLSCQATRTPQNVEPRVLAKIEEHSIKSSLSAVHSKKERINSNTPEVRRSRSLPRGKFTLS